VSRCERNVAYLDAAARDANAVQFDRQRSESSTHQGWISTKSAKLFPSCCRSLVRAARLLIKGVGKAVLHPEACAKTLWHPYSHPKTPLRPIQFVCLVWVFVTLQNFGGF
jgi:hypothetical protein